MKTLKPALLLVCANWLGCAGPAAPTTGPRAVATGASISSRGDLAPTALYQMPSRVGAIAISQVSMPVSPVELRRTNVLAEETTHTDALHIIASGTALRQQTIAIDSTDGDAHLFLTPQLTDENGALQALRGIVVLDPNGVQVNKRAPKAMHADGDLLPMSMIALAGHPAGIYTINFNDVAASAGIALDVRQPNTTIAMKLKPSVIQHLLGNPLSVGITLEDAGLGITGAQVQAYLVKPDLTRGPDLTVQEIGGGEYIIDAAVLTKDHITGAYLVDVRAVGTSAAGLPFLRHGRTGFHFGIPTGRVNSVTAARMVNDANGQIAAFEVDVSLESSTLDRLEISATLAATGADGLEHPISAAFTGGGFAPGQHTVTLRFDAGPIMMTKLEGTYALRNLAVYSLSTDSLFQQVEQHPARFEQIKRTMLLAPKVLTPQLNGLIESGALSLD